MLEEKLLIWRLARGRSDALERIYNRYKNELLALAIALSNDKSSAEDAVHDVFVALAEAAPKLRLRGSLKSYLSVALANRLRNMSRSKRTYAGAQAELEAVPSDAPQPAESAMSAEQFQRISRAMAQLPYEQREVIILHTQSGLRFRQIAKSRNVSVNTIQSRYRYGLNRLQLILNGEEKK